MSARRELTLSCRCRLASLIVAGFASRADTGTVMRRDVRLVFHGPGKRGGGVIVVTLITIGACVLQCAR